MEAIPVAFNSTACKSCMDIFPDFQNRANMGKEKRKSKKFGVSYGFAIEPGATVSQSFSHLACIHEDVMW